MNILFINPQGNGAYLPHIPPDFSIDGGIEVEEVATLDGKITIPNAKTLKTFTINALFPVKQYPWINKNANMSGWDYLRYFTDAMNNMDIMKIYVVNRNGLTLLYMKCIIESFTYHIDRRGDIVYSLTVKEYLTVDPKKVVKV